MAEILDDVAYLSQEIGPRPAGTEEEQQAALFVAQQAHKRSDLKAEIEDIKCNANSWMIDLIYFGISFLAVLLSIAAPAIGALTLIVSLICTGLFLCEKRFNRPLLSKWLSNDISQNVVVKYRPAAAEQSGSRRKIIVVTNYDSGRVMNDIRPGFLGILSKLFYAADIAIIATPVILFFKDVVFLHALGFVSGFFTILAVIAAVLMLVPVAHSLIRRSGAYNEAANVNASGVAVLLNLIRRVGVAEGIVPDEEPSASPEEDETVIHGVAEAYAAGVVPEGAQLQYESNAHNTAGETPAAAPMNAPAAAVAPQMSVPAPAVAPQVSAPAPAVAAPAPAVAPQEFAQAPHMSDAPHVVPAPAVAQAVPNAGQFSQEARQASTAAPSSQPAPATANEEGQESAAERLRAAKAAIAALTGAPVDDTIYTNEKPASVTSSAEEPIRVPDEAGREEMRSDMMSALGGVQGNDAAADQAVPAATAEAAAPAASSKPSEPAPGFASAPSHLEAISPSAAYADASRAASINKPAVPDWYRTAQEKAKRSDLPSSKVTRSRYAEALDSAVKESSAIFDEANQLLDKETEARLRNMRRGISEVKAPHILDQEGMATPTQAPAAPPQEKPAAQAATETPQAPQQPAPQQPVPPQPAPQPTPVPKAQPAAAPAPAEAPQTSAAPFAEAAPAPDPQAQAAQPMPVIVTEPVIRETIAGSKDSLAPAAGTSAAQPANREAAPGSENVTSNTTPMSSASPAAPAVESAIPAPPTHAPAIDSQIPSLQPKASDAASGLTAEGATEQRTSADSSQKTFASNPNLGRTVAMAPIEMPAPHAYNQAASTPANEPDLPRVTLPDVPSTNRNPIADTAKQRAPLAEASTEGGKTAAKSLLSHTIPKIDVASLSGDLGKPVSGDADKESAVDKRQNLMQSLPSLSGSITFEPGASAEKQEKVVSATGSFTAVSATGAFKPVGDELVADVDPEDRYVEDADDTIQEGSVTESGAFAAPDYVAMPKTRRGNFFGRFRRKKNRQEDELTPQEWLDVDDDFDARTVGRARGDWQSFQAGDARAHTADRQTDDVYDEYAEDTPYDGYEPYDANDGEMPNGVYGDAIPAGGNVNQPQGYYADDVYYDEDDYAEPETADAPLKETPTRDDSEDQKWQGGAFSAGRSSARRTEVYQGEDEFDADDASFEREHEPSRSQGILDRIKDSASSVGNAARNRMRRSDDEASTDHASVRRGNRPARSHTDQHAGNGRASRLTANEPIRTPRVTQEMREIYQFADESLDTEVWFVALGAQEEGDNAGLKQFIETHRDDLRGAIVVSLEGMGSGMLGYGSVEGIFKKQAPSTRLKRFLHTASQATGISLAQSDQTWRDSAAAVAMASGLQAVSIMGLDGNKPAFYAQSDDVLENINEELIKQNADYVMELLKAF